MDVALGVALLAFAGSLVTAVLTYRSSQQATDVNERASQLQWVKELRAEAADAKQQVKDLTTEVRELRRQLDVVTREAEQLVGEMRLMRRTAWREGMSIERFREFIGPPARNGGSSL